MRYFKVPYDLVKRTDLNEYEFRLLLMLLQKESEFNKEGKWFNIGYADIPLHHNTINKYRQSLKEKGLLDYKNGYSTDGKRSNTQYLLLIDRPTKEEKAEETPKPVENKPKTRKNCFGKEVPVEEF